MSKINAKFPQETLPADRRSVKQKPADWIRVRGARTHNLHNLDADLPRGRLTVITGPSGSGKSSLAFDTLFAEGQRRYLETLRTNTRALFVQLRRPDVDVVTGLPPVLCVAQHTGSPRPRSTLATVTEIHDHFRLLWARRGTPHCPQCGAEIRKHTVAEIVRETMQLPEGRKLFILAPLVEDQPGDQRDAFLRIRQSGFLRARVNGVLWEIRDIPKVDPRKRHTIELVVDRLVVRPGLEDRFHESIATASKHGQGRAIVTDAEDSDWNDRVYSTTLACPQCRTSVPDLEPRRFHFNNPYGACPRCTGLGQVWQLDPARVVTAEEILAWFPERKDLHALLTAADREVRAETDEELAEALERLSGYVVCPECHGARVNLAARSVKFAGRGIHEVHALDVDAAYTLFQPLHESPRDDRVLQILLKEIATRLHFLREVGLGYLALDRPATTLSGGEFQRARLATQLGGGLRNVCYILDEPTIGLHPRDTDRLLAALRVLQQRGNTLLIVEHDEAVMRAADYLIDIGPGAGAQGGRLLAQGTPEEVLANPASITAPYLRGEVTLAPSLIWSPPAQSIVIRGARQHNLKNIDVALPLGRLVCVTGVSGSGKSTLITGILWPALRRHLGLLAPTPGAHDSIEGLEAIDKLIEVDQKPLGRSARSSPATYTGLFDEIRKIFAATKLAKLRGYKANRFSFNSKGGRCEECLGHGEVKVALQFLPDLSVPCPSCQGKRFNLPTLEATFKGKSIADVLALSVAEARELFANVPNMERILRALDEVGLGYLSLGQPARQLSGGEAQRVKLATELARVASGRTLFLLDEPTTGLHRRDVAPLLEVFRRLVEAGNTVVVIEHHRDLIASADWVIDLGPEAGGAGGYLVAAGPPGAIQACPQSLTGRFI